MKYPEGRYLVVLDMAEARAYARVDRARWRSCPGDDPLCRAASPGFDFTRDLERVGLANQTTMLSSESLAIAEEVRRTMVRKYGESNAASTCAPSTRSARPRRSARTPWS